MNKKLYIVVGVVVVLAVGLLLRGDSTPPNSDSDPLQGVSFETEYFREGIQIGTTQQTIFDRTGALTTDSAVALNGGVTYIETIETVTADNTLTVAESGLTTYISTTGSTSTLPAVASSAGAVYRFVVAAAFSGSNFSIVAPEGDIIEGALIVAGAVVTCDAADAINFVADGENLGDFVEVRSNGTKWFVTQSNVLTSAKLTCTG